MNSLTLSQIENILSNIPVDKGIHHKYRAEIGKLHEVRNFLIGKGSRTPSDPFTLLTQLPKEWLD